MENIYDVIIIGAGPTGMYSSYLAHLHNLKVILLETSIDHGGQMKLFLDKPVYDLPGHLDINGKKIMNLIHKQFNIHDNAEVVYEDEVNEILGTQNAFEVITSKKKYYSKTVIIASGGGEFKPKPLGIPNEDKYKNIIYSIKDANKYINQKLLILGGGDTAIDWAHFYKDKSNVTLVHRRERFRGQENLLDDMKNSIRLMTPYKVKEIIGRERIEKVILQNVKTKEIKETYCDIVMVFYGQQKTSNKKTFNLKFDKEGYFVKSNMETTRSGIFAIGNVANYKGKVKTMITGFGEAATAVGSVLNIVRPGKKMSYYVKKKEN